MRQLILPLKYVPSLLMWPHDQERGGWFVATRDTEESPDSCPMLTCFIQFACRKCII